MPERIQLAVVGRWGPRLITRSGDVHIPMLETTEPLRAECAHSVACIRAGKTPISDGTNVELRLVR